MRKKPSRAVGRGQKPRQAMNATVAMTRPIYQATAMACASFDVPRRDLLADLHHHQNCEWYQHKRHYPPDANVGLQSVGQYCNRHEAAGAKRAFECHVRPVHVARPNIKSGKKRCVPIGANKEQTGVVAIGAIKVILSTSFETVFRTPASSWHGANANVAETQVIRLFVRVGA